MSEGWEGKSLKEGVTEYTEVTSVHCNSREFGVDKGESARCSGGIFETTAHEEGGEHGELLEYAHQRRQSTRV